MTWKSYLAVSAATVAAGWLAAHGPSEVPRRVVPTQPPAAAPVSAASDIEAQAERLQSRLRGEPRYREPARNLFRFGERPAPPAAPAAASGAPDAVAAETPPPSAADAPPPVPMTLAGVAADAQGTAIVRTAVLSTPGGITLARAGDVVLGEYRVLAVEERAVELERMADGSQIRLEMR